MKALKKYIIIPAALGFLLIAACGQIIAPDPFNNDRYKATSDFSFSISAEDKNALELNSINGSVVVIGDAASTEIVVSGTKIVKSDDEMDAQNYLKNLKVSIAESGDIVFVTSEQPQNTHGRNVSIEYEIHVPKDWGTSVDLANGSCVFDSLHGDITAQVTNGNVSLNDVNANVHVRVTNGQIEGRVELPPKGVLYAKTTNGVIVLGLPKTTSAKFSAGVTNGTVNVSGLSISDMTGSQREIRGTIGGGDGTIELRTTNGNISVSGY